MFEANRAPEAPATGDDTVGANITPFPTRHVAAQHQKLIDDSAITPEVAGARGYFTAIRKAELKRLGFADYQQNVPALVVPIYGVTGEVVTYQIRPDTPRVARGKNGKPSKALKYETVADSRIRLDVPPGARERLGNPAVPLFITEGARKADSAVSKGLCCVALLGVWNWRGANDEGGKVALADWESVALNDGRKVCIAFDSDVTEKRSVHMALKRFREFLESRGASVKIIYLPHGEGGTKVGLDDYFASGHTVDDLLTHATDKLKLPDIEDKHSDPAIPYGFALKDDGVYVVNFSEDGNSGEDFVCSPLRVTAQTRTEESTEWGKLLEWTDGDNVPHQWSMPVASLAGDGTEVRARLMGDGLTVASGRKMRDALNDYILKARPKANAVCVSRAGWHGDAFVYPDETINPPDGERLILQTMADFDNGFKTSGTLNEWKAQIGQRASGNTVLIFGISVALAAKLLKPLDIESGGFNLRGSSSKGKTTTLQVSASVDGSGGDRGGFVEGWKATANGLESMCERHNDSVLPLDELAQCDPHVAAEASYLIPNGQGKQRMARTVTSRRRLTWRTLFISSGELSLSDLLAQVGRRTRGGQEVRVLDIPVGERKHGVFDDLHDFKSGQEFANHLKLAAGRFYGMAAREFLRQLTADSVFPGLRSAFDEYLKTFVRTVTTDDDGNAIQVSSEVTRAATRFALVAFAGEIATGYGITEWADGEAEQSAVELFKLWLSNRGTSGNADEDTAIRQVQAFLEQHGASRFQRIFKRLDTNGRERIQTEDRTIVNRAGYVRPEENREDAEIAEYLISVEAFRSDICKGLDYKIVARALKAREFLITDGDGRLTRKQRTPEGNVPVYCVSSRIHERE